MGPKKLMATINSTSTEFDSLVTKPGITFVDFWAAWCGPCRAFAPVFEKSSEKYPDIQFVKVDTEAEQELAAAAQITSIPTLMAFRDGVLVFRQPGALPESSFEQLITAVKDLDMEEVRKEIAKQGSENK
jgi:thioredoxin 1